MSDAAVVMNEAAIRNMFRSYVEGTGGKPRHTQEAYLETGKFSAFITGAIPGNLPLQEELYQRMLNCAVEYEESGFIAGALFALRLPPEIKSSLGAVNPPAFPGAKPAPAPSATDAPAANANAAISSKRIAELFETTNAKVVNRIEEMILPHLDEQSKRFFRLDVERTAQRRRYKVYYMNKAACDLYLAEIEPHKKYVNIAGGIVKMRELMKSVFPVEAGVS